MSQNKYMHSRNAFKVPPDYTDLAIKYPNFRKICKLNLNGKVSIDLRTENALKSLTQTLLLDKFNLEVEFAPSSLIPTVPLRLNYILWIEDLMKSYSLTGCSGIDIGCGSSCIYSLLAVRQNVDWKMWALETNLQNIKYAEENIQRNNLSSQIKLFKQSEKNIIFKNFFDSLEDDKTFDFCICNPPFFDNTLPKKDRGNSRRKPKNLMTGVDEELCCEGGEVQFVKSIIDESIVFPNKIRIFTTMLGHKSSKSAIFDYLNLKNIPVVIETKFNQGNTTRWGVAWSFN